MKWAISKFSKIDLKKARPVVILVAVVACSLVLYWHYRAAQGEAGSPEKSTTDLDGNSKNSFKIGDSGYLNIKVYAKDAGASTSPAPNPSATPTTAANISVTEKLASQVEFNQLVSAIDKGGAERATVVSRSSGDPKTYINLSQIPRSYVCSPSKPECLSNAVKSGSTYTIYDNYVVLKIKFTAKEKGIIDLDSNYSACDSASPQKVSGDSKVEYRLSQKNVTFDMPAMCVTIGNSAALNVKKTTQDKDGSPKATFEAGDQVWVKLEIDEPGDSRTNYKITDAIPKSVSGEISYTFKGSDGSLKEDQKTRASDGKVEFTGSDEMKLLNGRNTIEYSYRI